MCCLDAIGRQRRDFAGNFVACDAALVLVLISTVATRLELISGANHLEALSFEFRDCGVQVVADGCAELRSSPFATSFLDARVGILSYVNAKFIDHEFEDILEGWAESRTPSREMQIAELRRPCTFFQVFLTPFTSPFASSLVHRPHHVVALGMNIEM